MKPTALGLHFLFFFFLFVWNTLCEGFLCNDPLKKKLREVTKNNTNCNDHHDRSLASTFVFISLFFFFLSFFFFFSFCFFGSALLSLCKKRSTKGNLNRRSSVKFFHSIRIDCCFLYIKKKKNLILQ